MNEYIVRLKDDRRISVFAHQRSGIAEALEAEGHSRSEVAGVRRIERRIRFALFTGPFVGDESSYADAAA